MSEGDKFAPSEEDSSRQGHHGPPDGDKRSVSSFSSSSHDDENKNNLKEQQQQQQQQSLALADLPDGVTWKQNTTNPSEWTLIRIDQQHTKDLYKLQPAITWNPNTGREQMIVKPVPKKKRSDHDDDNETVATSTSIGGDDDVDDDSCAIDYDNLDDEQELRELTTLSCIVEEVPKQKKEPPVLGRDYVIHTILPSDTFSGLLLRYKITAVTLRRINQFSGTNLALAPSQLVIPLKTSLSNIKIQDVSSSEYKLEVLLIEFPHLNIMERKAYLQINDWDLEVTKQQIQDDRDWETKQIQQEKKIASKLKSLEL